MADASHFIVKKYNDIIRSSRKQPPPSDFIEQDHGGETLLQFNGQARQIILNHYSVCMLRTSFGSCTLYYPKPAHSLSWLDECQANPDIETYPLSMDITGYRHCTQNPRKENLPTRPSFPMLVMTQPLLVPSTGQTPRATYPELES